MKLIISLGLAIGIVLTIIGTSWFFITHPAPEGATSSVNFQPQAPRQFFDLIISQSGPNQKRILRCQKNLDCQAQIIPASLDSDPIFDGLSWYHYVNQENPAPKQPTLVLRRSWLETNQPSETIVEETPLVRPRGLYLSPDGHKVAYWLDNITDGKKKLTELWVYDSRRGSTTIVSENLAVSDILTSLYWNKSATHLWFFNQNHELRVIPTDNVQPYLPPKNLVVDLDPENILTGQIDISQTGLRLAYVTQVDSPRQQPPVSTLTIEEPNQSPIQTTLTGLIAYLEWLPDDSLIYALQDALGTSFWRFSQGQHNFLARHDQIIQAARSDLDQKFIIFTSLDQSPQVNFNILNLAAKSIQPLGQLTAVGDTATIVRVQHRVEEDAPRVAGVSTKLSDEELVAFVDRNLENILNLPDARATKLLMTDQDNTLYLDFKTKDTTGRVLLTVHDAIHDEWSVRAWYREYGLEWRKTEGSSLKDPAATRWYEWESGLNQWVLKSERK